MTRARSLKQTIRARAAKTGESYTTARRHVLNARASSASRRVTTRADEAAPGPAAVRAAAAAPASAVPAARKKGGASGTLTDANCRLRTGHGLDHWFSVLDAFNVPPKGHTALARHLHDDHQVPGWHAQGITVAYERERGLRTMNQSCAGDFQVSVSKVVPATVRQVVDAFVKPARRAEWLGSAPDGLVEAVDAALGRTSSQRFIVKDPMNARLRFKWGQGTVELRLTGKPGPKTSVVADNSKLADERSIDERRTAWRAALATLHGLFEAGGGRPAAGGSKPVVRNSRLRTQHSQRS
jgi:hypothetical protein